MSKLLAILAGLLLLAVLVLFSTTYTVRFNEVAIKTTLGRTSDSSIVREPGLHGRLPLFAERVAKLDTRLQLIETPLETIATADDQQVVVRAFLFWQVNGEGDGPLEFLRKYGDSVDNAMPALTDQFREAVKDQMSRFAFDDLVGDSGRLKEAEKSIVEALAKQAAGTGVRPVTAGLSQFLLPPRTTTAVLTRMQATRQRLAEAERSKGQAEAANIMSAANSAAQKILAFVDQRADEIRNQGNSKAAEFFKQMSQAEDFAVFLVQVEALKKALAQYTILVLPTTQQPFHLMDLRSPLSSTGIPVPAGEAPTLAPTQGAPAPAHPASPTPADRGR